MKKIKFVLMGTAIIGGISAAIATTNIKAPCEYMTQYAYVNGAYVMVGTYGLDYFCVGAVGVCTWYKPWPGSDWTPCKSGFYLPIEEFNKLKK